MIVIGNDSLSSSIFASPNECQLTKSFQATRTLHISSLLFAEGPVQEKGQMAHFVIYKKF